MASIEWQGVDTVYICAGVSSLRPLLDIADSPQGTKETSVEGIRRTGEVAQKAITGNFTGPLLTAVTFVSPRHCLVHNLTSMVDPTTPPYLSLSFDPPHLLCSRSHPRTHSFTLLREQSIVTHALPSLGN